MQQADDQSAAEEDQPYYNVHIDTGKYMNQLYELSYLEVSGSFWFVCVPSPVTDHKDRARCSET